MRERHSFPDVHKMWLRVSAYHLKYREESICRSLQSKHINHKWMGQLEAAEGSARGRVDTRLLLFL